MKSVLAKSCVTSADGVQIGKVGTKRQQQQQKKEKQQQEQQQQSQLGYEAIVA